MSSPAENYQHWLTHWSDIQAHLPRLFEAAHGNVLELGVRFGVSTSALLAGVEQHGGHLWSVDIDPNCGGLYAGHAQWTFIHANSTDKEAIVAAGVPEALDCLFIDTVHTYRHTYHELCTWGPLVRAGGCILLHDTDDGTTYPGVRNAILRWSRWRNKLYYLYPESYGLGVIKC